MACQLHEGGGLGGRELLHQRVLPQSGGADAPQILQKLPGAGLVLFPAGKQQLQAVDIPRPRQAGGLDRVLQHGPAGVVIDAGQSAADASSHGPGQEFRLGAAGTGLAQVGHAVLLAHRRHGKADAPAADGGQHRRRRGGREDEQHPFRGLFQHLQQGVGTGGVESLGAVEDHHPAGALQGGGKDLPAHLADAVDADLPCGPFSPHLDAVLGAAFHHQPGAVPAVGPEVVGGQTPGRKAGAGPLLPCQKDTMRKPPCCQGGFDSLYRRAVARHPVQHHSFSNRSTLVTKTVAPPTVTCRG